MQEEAGVVGVHENVIEVIVLDRREHLYDAIFKRLGPDEANIRILPGLPEQMLASPKTDLEPDLPHITTEKPAQRRWLLSSNGGRSSRQELAHQTLLAWREFATTTAAVGSQLDRHAVGATAETIVVVGGVRHGDVLMAAGAASRNGQPKRNDAGHRRPPALTQAAPGVPERRHSISGIS